MLAVAKQELKNIETFGVEQTFRFLGCSFHALETKVNRDLFSVDSLTYLKVKEFLFSYEENISERFGSDKIAPFSRAWETKVNPRLKGDWNPQIKGDPGCLEIASPVFGNLATFAAYSDLVGDGKYITTLNPVAGEIYTDITINQGETQVSLDVTALGTNSPVTYSH